MSKRFSYFLTENVLSILRRTLTLLKIFYKRYLTFCPWWRAIVDPTNGFCIRFHRVKLHVIELTQSCNCAVTHRMATQMHDAILKAFSLRNILQMHQDTYTTHTSMIDDAKLVGVPVIPSINI